MSALSRNSTANATSSSTCGPTMKGSRHVSLSAKIDEVTAAMVLQTHGGAVSSCACMLVKPTVVLRLSFQVAGKKI